MCDPTLKQHRAAVWCLLGGCSGNPVQCKYTGDADLCWLNVGPTSSDWSRWPSRPIRRLQHTVTCARIRTHSGTVLRFIPRKWNESGFRPPLCTYRPPEDGEMIEMTLSSRHRIRNSRPGGLRPSTLPLGHGGSPQYWLSHVDGEERFFVSFKPPRPGTEPRTLTWKAAVLATTLGPPPFIPRISITFRGSWRCANFREVAGSSVPGRRSWDSRG